MLRDQCKVIVQTGPEAPNADVLIALHARRSAEAVDRYRRQGPRSPLAVVLTGTDLYRDLPESAAARRSLDVADRIVVLQDHALTLLEPAWRAKAQVIFQSAKALPKRPKPRGPLDCIAVGHLRPEKDPATLFEAVERLPRDLTIRFRHIGAGLDESLARRAVALARREPRYRYSGALPHGLTRAAIASAHLLVHPSRMEGGANVIVEAVTAGTPVLASRVSGNLGMLGAEYPAYFDVRDGKALASLLMEASSQRPTLRKWREAGRKRKPLFRPEREAREIRKLVAEMLA